MKKAFDFLEIQKQALEAGSQKALGFAIVNLTLKLFPYKQAIFWTGGEGALSFEGVSGNASIDDKGPYALWLQKTIKAQTQKTDNPLVLKRADIPDKRQDEWCVDHIVIVSLYNAKGEKIGGVWIERNEEFQDAEIALLGELKPAWETRLSLFQKDKGFHLASWWGALQKRKQYIWAALFILLFFPVRLNITAPAEIVAQDKMVASAPYNGIVKTVLVQPGQKVEEGQVLAEMESEELKSQADAAQRALETAKSSLARMKREAITVPEKKVELNLLQSEIAAKDIEYQYAKTMLERSEIKSPRDGVAILSDVNQYQNKPVVAGETLIEIASPDDVEVLVRVPVDAMIKFSKDTPVSFYLNVSPLSKVKADIQTIGYQASPDPDGLLTYKIRAKPKDTSKDMRIGWKGTAKIYGNWTILSYAVIRRPLVALRRLGGG